MKTTLILMAHLFFALTTFANPISPGYPNPTDSCGPGEHLQCAPHLAGGCNNMICVPIVKPRPSLPNPEYSCDASENDAPFRIIGTQVPGERCEKGYFYPGCQRTSLEDAELKARKKCFQLNAWAIKVGPIKKINDQQVQVTYQCSCER